MPHSLDHLPDSKLLENFLRLEKHNQAADPQVWRDMERRYGASIHSRVLFLLTRKHFNPEEARQHWFNILEHAEAMRLALGREVGVRLAMCDYLINLVHQIRDPLLVEGDTIRQKESSAYRDELTGLYNRRFFNRALQQQVAEAQRFEQPFSLIMLDIDEFKKYNDVNGHMAGDRALAEVASILATTARTIDHLVRYGGEEFMVILPRTNKQEATVAAERHRQAVEQHHFSGEESIPSGKLTLSAGVASYPHDANNPTDLIHKADMALYSAKRQSRNCVATAGPERREHPRVKHVAQVDYRLAMGGHGFHQGETLDISYNGLRLAINQPVQKDQHLELMIHTDNEGATLNIQGQTVHVYYNPFKDQPYTLGVRLDATQSNASRSALRALLEHNPCHAN